jgi:hypothetical protein
MPGCSSICPQLVPDQWWLLTEQHACQAANTCLPACLLLHVGCCTILINGGDCDNWCRAVEAEAKMLKGMRSQLRVCTATIGDAAAADLDNYANLYGTILIWLGEWVQMRDTGGGG